jgi:hypothetical protein
MDAEHAEMTRPTTSKFEKENQFSNRNGLERHTFQFEVARDSEELLYPLSQIATRSSGSPGWDVVRRLPHEASAVAVRTNLWQGCETLSLRNILECDNNNQTINHRLLDGTLELRPASLSFENRKSAPAKSSKFTRTVLRYQALSAGAKD